MKKILLALTVSLAGGIAVFYFVITRSPFGSILDQTTSVEIHFLEYDPPKNGTEESEDRFLIGPYDDYRASLISVTLSNSEIREFLPILKTATKPNIFSMTMCHFPEYGVRIYSKDDLLAETSICFGCKNFYARGFGGEYSYMTLSDYEPLQNFLYQILRSPHKSKTNVGAYQVAPGNACFAPVS